MSTTGLKDSWPSSPSTRTETDISRITDDDEQRIVAAVSRDLVATMGPGLEHMAIAEAARIRSWFASTIAEYERQVVEDVQQRLHDERLDTTWPKCPQHPNHPLWYSDGWWACPRNGRVARLGDLSE